MAPLAALQPPEDAVEIHIEGDGAAMPSIDPATGAVSIPTDDGGVEIQFPGSFEDQEGNDSEFDVNLAEYIDPGHRGTIADDLVQAIDQDDHDRRQWLDNRAKGIDLLAMQLEPPRSDVAASSGSLEGMSSIRNPLLLEAVLRFQATARGELLPAGGPVKVANDGLQTAETDADADKLEQDMNTYLTVTASEYYPDTDQLLFSVGFGGCGFKKVYHCPLRRRPVSESVDAKDLIVPNSAKDLRNATRITHQIQMPPNVMKRMQIIGVYRDVELTQPTFMPNAVQAKLQKTTGVSPSAMRPQDQDFTLYECYCELDIPGFEDLGEDGQPSGLKLPYRVVIDKTSKEILEIRRNWAEDDETKTAKRVFVKYSFVPWFGFYDAGLLNILGNASAALTAAWRICLDNGMFSNFPGFLFSDASVGRQITNTFRVPPGGGLGLKIGNADIRTATMPLPYKDLGANFAGFIEQVQATLQRVGGTAESQVGEGRSDAPVGTTLALIEQTKLVQDAVHKRLHAAQAEEFQLLKERFREDPEAFWRHNKSPQFPQDRQQLLDALENFELVPVADPNVPSQIHRHAKIAALMQLVQVYQMAFDLPSVLQLVLREMRFDDPQSLLAKPQPPMPMPPPPPDPRMLIAQMKNQTDIQKMQTQADQADKDRKSKENLEILRMAKEQVIHPAAAGQAANPILPPGFSQQGNAAP